MLNRRGKRAVAGAALAALVISACEPTNQGYSPEQPIKYSHAVHAGALRIPCQYCHFAAERGRHAGIPPASVCMNCHRQVLKDSPEVLKIKAAIDEERPIAWVKVYRLPDHVYFNHSVHVNGGIVCQTCHGPVEEMSRVSQWPPVTMGWCLDCHRGDPAKPDYERGGRLTDCAVCHH